MDDHVLSSFSALVLSFLLFAFVILKTYKKSKTTRKLPPGPWKLPIIGNMHQLVSPLPHRRLRDLAKKYGPVMHLQLGQVPHLVICSPGAAMDVLKTHDIMFSERPCSLAATIITYNRSNLGFGPYGEYWRQLRKICTVELLSAKRVESFRSIREEEVSSLVRSIVTSSREGSQPVNLSRMLLSLTSNIVSRTVLGMSSKQTDEFMLLLDRISEILGGFNIGDFFPSFKILHIISGIRPKVMKLHREMDNILQSVIDEHKERRNTVASIGARDKANNLLDVLLDIQDHGDLEFPLTTESIKGILFDMFAGGTESSATVLEWTMSELLRDPLAKQKVQEEVKGLLIRDNTSTDNEETIFGCKYMDAVLKETLRLHPPAPLLVPRETRGNISINGYEISIKTKVFINAWAIGRDPDFWVEPEKFYPERFVDSQIDYKGTNFEFIPFGAGRRMCPGWHFGMSTVHLALANLLCHFDWELPNGMTPEKLDMSEEFGLVVRRKNPLQVIAIPRSFS